MARTVNVGVVTIRGLVFDMRSRDGDTTFPLFGSFVDGAIIEELCKTLLCLTLRYGSSQGSLGMSVCAQVHLDPRDKPSRDLHGRLCLNSHQLQLLEYSKFLTNVDVRLVSFENCCILSRDESVVAECLEDGVGARRRRC
jgi:hypothetical protein